MIDRRRPPRCGTRSVTVCIVLLACGLMVMRPKKIALLRRRAYPSAPAACPRPAEPPRVDGDAAHPLADVHLSAYERATLTAAQRQAWGTIAGTIATSAALLIGIGALFISLRTWQSQADREEKVYSAQVAVWATLGDEVSSVLPAGLDVHVQNRAPVPMHGARILAPLTSGGHAEVRLGDLHPCTVQSLRIAPPEGETFVRGDEQWLGYTELILEFTETSRVWRLTKDGLERTREQHNQNPLPDLPQANHAEARAGDCG